MAELRGMGRRRPRLLFNKGKFLYPDILHPERFASKLESRADSGNEGDELEEGQNREFGDLDREGKGSG